MPKFSMPTFLKVPSRISEDNLMPYRQTIMWAIIIGLLGGLIATGYYLLLTGGLYVIWDMLKPALTNFLALSAGGQFVTIGLTTLGGFFVGLCIKWMRTPGEISAVVDNIHVKNGRMDYSQNSSMLVNSLVSIIFGGSAGPEAPLVQLIGSNSSKLGEKLDLHEDLIRTFTFCGMAAALGAFFGAPIGGALFALEIPHNRGLEYYEALIPSVISAVAAFLLFRSLVGYDGAFYHLPALSQASIVSVFEGILMGVVGAAIAVLFIWSFKKIEQLLELFKARPILLGAFGGLMIGLLAMLIPANFVTTPLFWSEYQIPELLNGLSTLQTGYTLWGAVGLLGLLALIKMVSIGFTLHSGFRGGFIFPLFFIGAVCGVALSLATGQMIPYAVAIIGLMAGVNVSVTKTPISTSIILISLTGSALLPVVAAASITSYICTERVRLISTQQHRTDNPSPMHRVWRWKET